jgi:hypothetical protein
VAEHSARSRLYQDALYEALSGSSTAVADADPLHLLSSLIARCRPLVLEAEHGAAALDALARVAQQPGLEAGLADAAIRFESPQRFREALFFARCLERDSDAALALLEARAYLEGAAVPAALYPNLALDQAALLDATTFAAMWREPERRTWYLDTIDIWKRGYIPVYTERHAVFNTDLNQVAGLVDGFKPQAVALDRLNSLDRLGAPQAVVALQQFDELERLFGCPTDAEGLGHLLAAAPVCAYCGYRLGEDPPTADARRVQTAIERGLAQQQARLAQRVVTRLLARPGRAGSDHLDRFVEVVQASDLTGLAAVLDEGLMAFLRELLDAPEPSNNLVDRLAVSYPEITAANLDEAMGALRLIIQEELRANHGRLQLRPPDGA